MGKCKLSSYTMVRYFNYWCWYWRFFNQRQEKYSDIFTKKLLYIFLLYIILRAFNLGDYNHVSNHDFLVSFLGVIKYPPSIAFFALTLTIIFLLFWFFDKHDTSCYFKLLVIFGQAPLFFYFAHYYLYIILSKFTNHMVPLYVMYIIWAFGLLLLFPIVKFYGQFKNKKGKNSLWKYF